MDLQGLRKHRDDILGLAARYRSRNVRVFGSVVRGENKKGSDVDFLISTEPGCSLLHLGGFLCDLEDLLGCPVDLVTEDGLKPDIRNEVMREAQPL